MIDYSTPRFKTSQVAMACSIAPPTLRSYFQRGQFRIIGKKAEGDGLPNLFSLRDAMTFAVAVRLVAAGAEPKEAFDLTVGNFSHIGDEDRGPAGLFDFREKGHTLMVYWPMERRAEVMAEDDIKSLYDIGISSSQRGEMVTLVPLNPIQQAVFFHLGVETE